MSDIPGSQSGSSLSLTELLAEASFRRNFLLSVKAIGCLELNHLLAAAYEMRIASAKKKRQARKSLDRVVVGEIFYA